MSRARSSMFCPRWRAAGVALAVLAATVSTTPAWAAGKEKARKVQKGQAKELQLVWPLPPEQPRIKYIGAIYGTADVEGVRKGNFLDRIAAIRREESKPTFLKPFGVASDSQGRFWVSDSGQGVVFGFDREKRKVYYVGRSAQVRLKVPLGVMVDSKDRIWVADAVGQRVYAFDEAGSVVAAVGSPDNLQNPTTMALNEALGRLYVLDSKGHCIVVFNPQTGELIKKIGKRGEGKGEFNYPTNLVIDKNGTLYVSDTMNFRVQILDPDGNFIAGFGGHGYRMGQFMKPKGLSIDAWGNVYVVDSDFANVQIFDKDSRLLMAFGGYGRGPGQFWLPADVHVDRNNFVYVTDQNNYRVQIFQLLAGETSDQDRSVLKTRSGTEEVKDPTRSE